MHPLAIPIWEKKIESTWNLRNKKKTREKLLIVLPSSNVLSFSFFLLTLSFLSYSSLMPIQLKVNTHIYFSFVFYAVFILISRDLIINRIIFLLEVYTHTHTHTYIRLKICHQYRREIYVAKMWWKANKTCIHSAFSFHHTSNISMVSFVSRIMFSTNLKHKWKPSDDNDAEFKMVSIFCHLMFIFDRRTSVFYNVNICNRFVIDVWHTLSKNSENGLMTKKYERLSCSLINKKKIFIDNDIDDDDEEDLEIVIHRTDLFKWLIN